MEPKEKLNQVIPYPVSKEMKADCLRLDMNENSFGCPSEVIRALRGIRQGDISRYPEYDSFLGKWAGRFGYSTEEICLTAGGDEGIRAVMEAFVDCGEEVIFPVPGFSIYPISARIQGAELVEIPYHDDFSFPTEEVIAAISLRTRAVIVISPNNPTGTTISKCDLLKILQKFDRGPVILDHTYCRFSGDDFSMILRDYPQLVVLHSLSKIFGLAGLRIGYVLANPKVIEGIRKVLPPFSVNAMALIAAETLLCCENETARRISMIVKEREWLAKELKKLGVGVVPSSANFLLCDFGKDCQRIFDELKARKILVKNYPVESRLSGHLRITVGQSKDNRSLLTVLRAVLPPPALIFDMDGVLVDVRRSYRRAIAETASFFLGRRVTADEVDRVKRRPGMNNDWDVTAALIEGAGMKVPIDKVISRFQSFYWGRNGDGLIKRETWLVDRLLLEKIAERVPMGIVTGRPRREAEHVLRKNCVGDLFGTVITMEDVGNRGKPDPLGIQMAMQNLSARRACYFGDHVDDMKAANAAGIEAIGVVGSAPEKGLRRRLLKESGAVRLIRSVQEEMEEFDEKCKN